jgi:hypothetical protein
MSQRPARYASCRARRVHGNDELWPCVNKPQGVVHVLDGFGGGEPQSFVFLVPIAWNVVFAKSTNETQFILVVVRTKKGRNKKHSSPDRGDCAASRVSVLKHVKWA